MNPDFDKERPSDPPPPQILGPRVGDPSSIIDLSQYQPSAAPPDDVRIERAIGEGVVPGNIRPELENPLVKRAVVSYLDRYSDVVTIRDFEDRFGALVLLAARDYRGGAQGADAASLDSEHHRVVVAALDLLDGGFLSVDEASEAVTWPSRFGEIERAAKARLIGEPPRPEEDSAER